MTATEDGFDERYVRYREHAELAKEFAELKASQAQNSAALQRIEALLIARPQQPPQQETAAALALHRALDAFDKAPRGQSNNILSHVGVLAIGAFAAWAFMVLS